MCISICWFPASFLLSLYMFSVPDSIRFYARFSPISLFVLYVCPCMLSLLSMPSQKRRILPIVPLLCSLLQSMPQVAELHAFTYHLAMLFAMRPEAQSVNVLLIMLIGLFVHWSDSRAHYVRLLSCLIQSQNWPQRRGVASVTCCQEINQRRSAEHGCSCLSAFGIYFLFFPL